MYVHVINEDGTLMVLLFSVTVPTCLDALAFSDLMIKFILLLKQLKQQNHVFLCTE